MKTLKEEVIKMLMDRIGVAEDEEFEARLANGECEVNKFCIGNCFRTKELAEAHKEEILKILKGEYDE